MAPLRVGFQRPEPPIVAGISLLTTGLVAAIVLGNTLGSPAGSGSPGSPSGPGRPASSGVAGATPSTPGPDSPAPGTTPPAPAAPTPTHVAPTANAVAWRPLAWSPDGRYLAVAQDVSGGVELALLVPGVSSDPVPLVRDVDERSVQWSPGGSHVVAVATDEFGTPEVVLVTITGTAARVEPLGPGALAAWSSDGRLVLVVDETRLLTYHVPASSTGVAPSLAAPTVLARDADPRCPPASTPQGLISYCRTDGTLVLVPSPAG